MQFNPITECYEREGFEPVRKSDILEIINSYSYVPDYIQNSLERKNIKKYNADRFITLFFFLDYDYVIESLLIVSEDYPDDIKKIINTNFSYVRTALIQGILRSKYPEKTIGYLYMLGFGETSEVIGNLAGIAEWEINYKLDFRILFWLTMHYQNKNRELYTRILNGFFKYGLSLDVLGEGKSDYHTIHLAEYISERTFKEPYKNLTKDFLRLSYIYYQYRFNLSLFDRILIVKSEFE